MKDLKELVRPNIWNLKPYSSARNEFHGEASVFLDANENPYNEPYNRYPDPLQRELKGRISALTRVSPESIFLGNGSDEPIDLLIRIFCEPDKDTMISIDPSYGMYLVAADINNVECRKVRLNDDFSLNADAVLQAVDATTKLVFLCSPNNPTGNVLNRMEVNKIINGFQGIVVMDEAYIDFSSSPSFINELESHPNIVVLQTFSKSWGAAGIRLGIAFASEAIIDILNKVKYPYNINRLTQEKALALLNDEQNIRKQVQVILNERTLLRQALCELSFVKRVYPSEANFLLVKVDDAPATYQYLVEKGIIVRNRDTVALCEGCLRITVGTSEQNSRLLKALHDKK